MEPIGWLFLLGLWYLFFWLYRDYRIDLVRERLFALREELFDIAAAGELSFDTRAYGMLRSTINGSIQFAHKMDFIEILAFVFLVTRDEEAQVAHRAYEYELDVNMEKVAPETAEKLSKIRDQVHMIFVEQAIFTSFVMMIVFWSLLMPIALLYGLGKASSRKIGTIREASYQGINHLRGNSRIQDWTESLDYAATLAAS